ncbi:hypothetical protein ACJD0Z_04445 [Flavobacteriaceae bacterium M23B6Z8]
MKKYLFTALLAIAFAFTTSAATTTETEPIQSIELTENMIIATSAEDIVDEDCEYLGYYAIQVNGRLVGFAHVYRC